MLVMLKRFIRSFWREAGLALSLVIMASALPVSAEVPQSTEDNNARVQQQRGGGGQVVAPPQARPVPQAQPQFQRPQPQAQQQFQRPQVQAQQQYQRPQEQFERGPRGGYGNDFNDDSDRRRYEPRPSYRRPEYAVEEPGYRRGGAFGRACATSRGVCYVRRPEPYGAPCRCDIPGFGPKRGNIEG